MFPGLVGLERDAGRQAPGRAVGDVESPVVLGAFDKRAGHETVGEVGVAVGAEAVGGIQVAVGGAVDGVGLAFVVEANDVLLSQEAAGADLDPAVDGLALGGENVRSGRGVGADGSAWAVPVGRSRRGLSSAGRGRE